MASGTLSKEVIPNQVFLGCPWRIVRRKYLDVTEEMNKKFPIHFVIIGSEVGHSAEDLLKYLNMSTHGKAAGASGSTIISDLAGKRRKEYKNEKSLMRLMTDFSKGHPYTIKFEKAIRNMMKNFDKGEKKSYRALSLKIIHYLDDNEVARRDDLLHSVASMNPNYADDIVDDWIKKMHGQKLIRVTQGRYSDVIIA